MNKILLFITLIMTSWLTLSAHPSSSYEVLLYEDNESVPDEEDPEGRRNLTYEIIATISIDRGVILHNFEGEISLYVIEDAVSLTTVGSFISEQDFIDCLYSLSGKIRIRLYTNYSPLIGYINLNN